MFTVPDASDAVPACPPLAPVGPQPSGFFADCNPTQNFPGTRPVADHFNELILNLRALLTQAGIAAVKGDPTMLWRAVLWLPEITAPLTLNVATTGVPVPANPRGGNPFDSLASAMAYLRPYRLLEAVTINVAAGRYTSTTPLLLTHPDGQAISINGAGLSATTLAFTAAAGSAVIWETPAYIGNLSIEGDSGGASNNGLVVISGGPGGTLENVEVRQFSAAGVWVQPEAWCTVKTALTARNNHGQGILIDNGAVLDTFAAATVTAIGATTASNVEIRNGASLYVDTLVTDTGAGTGLLIHGPGAMAQIRVLTLTNVGTPTSAVLVNSGSLQAVDGTTANLWAASAGATAGTFRAQNGGIIVAGNALTAACRAAASPPVNTVGNTQAYIQAQ